MVDPRFSYDEYFWVVVYSENEEGALNSMNIYL